MADDYDSPWKEVLDVFFEQFMAFFFPQAHREIDWSRNVESLDKELQKIVKDGKLGRRFVDKLVKVWLKDGQERWILLHIEVQSSKDNDLPKRIFVYNYRLYDKYNRLVVSLVVLGDDNPDWRPDEFNNSLWGFHIGIKYPVVKLLDYADRVDELERDSNPFAMIVLAHLATMQTRNDPSARKAAKVRLVKGLHNRGMTTDSMRQLFRAIDWMLELPKPMEIEFLNEIEQLDKEKIMPYVTTPERIGEERGMERGLAEGRVEGRVEGVVEGLVTAIENLIATKFGQVDAGLIAQIRREHDPQSLLSIHSAAATATSIDEFRSRIVQ